MRTTIDINDALLKELRHKASRENRTFRKTIEHVLHLGLSSQLPPQEVEIESAPIGIKRVYQGQSMNQLYDQLESEDIQRVAEP